MKQFLSIETIHNIMKVSLIGYRTDSRLYCTTTHSIRLLCVEQEIGSNVERNINSFALTDARDSVSMCVRQQLPAITKIWKFFNTFFFSLQAKCSRKMSSIMFIFCAHEGVTRCQEISPKF